MTRPGEEAIPVDMLGRYPVYRRQNTLRSMSNGHSSPSAIVLRTTTPTQTNQRQIPAYEQLVDAGKKGEVDEVPPRRERRTMRAQELNDGENDGRSEAGDSSYCEVSDESDESFVVEVKKRAKCRKNKHAEMVEQRDDVVDISAGSKKTTVKAPPNPALDKLAPPVDKRRRDSDLQDQADDTSITSKRRKVDDSQKSDGTQPTTDVSGSCSQGQPEDETPSQPPLVQQVLNCEEVLWDVDRYDASQQRARAEMLRRRAELALEGSLLPRQCVACAEVQEACTQRRKTVGCVRCNAKSIFCSFRRGMCVDAVPDVETNAHISLLPRCLRDSS